MSPRLSLATLEQASAAVARPRVDPRALGTGIVHLGLGAFHRGHQAMITEDAMAVSGDVGWGIVGTSQRSRGVVDQLVPQDGLYTVLEKSPERVSARVVGSIRGALFAGDDHEAILDRIADPATRIVSLTITEKGYQLATGGGLDFDAPDVGADLQALRSDSSDPSRTAIGMLARGLVRRGSAPLTVLPCDNMVSNGSTLRRAVADFLDAAGRATALDGVGFASTVVDRIVPTTGDAGRREVEQLLGLRDEAAVLGEPFWQWVVEDDFRAGRPAWDEVGVTFADDVRPFELLKLRLLNSSHSLLAYLGALAGFDRIAEAIEVPEFEEAAWRLIADEAAPGLDLPDGVDPLAYGRSVLERYRNAALGHQTLQVTMDGSQKLPLRSVPTALETLARGGSPSAAALTVAAWMVFVARGRDVTGRPLPLDDPRAADLHAAAAGPESGLAERMLALDWIFPAELADDLRWRELVTAAVARFASDEPTAWVRF